MQFVLLINLKLLTFVNSFSLNIAEHETFLEFSYLSEKKSSCSAEHEKEFYNFGARITSYHNYTVYGLNIFRTMGICSRHG